jgi:tetratricopeptide (TPR) repeat protein
MVDYRVYSTRHHAILMKNNLVAEGGPRELALLMPEIARSVITSIEFAERGLLRTAPVVAPGPARLLEAPAAQEVSVGIDPAGPAVAAVGPMVETPDAAEAALPMSAYDPALGAASFVDPRAEAADEERERARALDEVYRQRLEDREAPASEPTADGLMRADEAAPVVQPDAPEAHLVSPTPELAPLALPSLTLRTEPEPRQMDPVETAPYAWQRDAKVGAAGDEIGRTVATVAKPTIGAPGLDTPGEERVAGSEPPLRPIDLTSQAAAREAYDASRELPPTDVAGRIVMLEQAAILDPVSADYAKSLALNYYKAGRYGRCIESSLRAAELAPSDSIVRTILGSAYFEKGRFDEALAAHEAALELDASNLYSRFNVALTLQAQGSSRALGAWREYLDLSVGVEAQEDNRIRARTYYDDLKAGSR